MVALGDSLSCGEGVGIHVEPGQTWAAQLTDAIPGASMIQMAVAGARVRDVISHQLPRAVSQRPDLATVLVGLNDIIRSGFRPDRFRAELGVLVHSLRATGATVLLATLHDPGALRPLPLTKRLRRQLVARVAIVNDTVWALAAADDRIRVLDLAGIYDLRLLGAWEVDRVHFSPAGHRLIADSAVRALTGSDLPEPVPLPPQRIPGAPGRPARIRWVLACGIPWLIQHGGRVAPAALRMGVERSGRPEFLAGTGDGDAFQPAAVQPAHGRVGAGLGEHAGTPEVAGALG